ncbi:MAG: protein-signal peptide and transmembrane prediction [Cyclobacteriaceae bacterium]
MLLTNLDKRGASLIFGRVTGFLFWITLCFSCQNHSGTPHPDQTPAPELLTLAARTQVQNGEHWQTKERDLTWNPYETAIIICDMWDKHWCDSATARVTKMAPAVNQMIQLARKKGVTIVHAPSSTMEFYKDHLGRKKAQEAPEVEPPIPLSYWFDPDSTREASLPIDDSDEGCDCPGNEPSSVWTRQIETIEILDEDLISDSGQEIYNYFEKENINNVVLCGVHTNMCVLGRTFGIRGQVKLDRNVLLVRDLTDAMYNPEMPPYVSHREGTELVIQHIEKYWAPSVEWKDIID